MAYATITSRLSSLPLLLAGPIVRRTEPTQVSVWFVLRKDRKATLEIFETNSATDVETLMSGTLDSGIGIGEHVFVYCITARGETMEAGTNYYYDIDFGEGDTLSNLVNAGLDLTYDGSLRPSFTLPPDTLDDVRLIHGSCRKPHGEGYDAMEGVHEMLLTAVDNNIISALVRPHQLFLTGDQIYADDVADALLYMIDDAAKALFGWDEVLHYAPFTKDDLRPGKRNTDDKLSKKVGFTGMVPGKPELSKSHLLQFREYATMYLFAWSDVLWPSDKPSDGKKDTTDPHEDGSWPSYKIMDSEKADSLYEYIKYRRHLKFFEDEKTHLKRFKSTLKNVRKALANIPTYMIFDDHEITDDWNLNWRWCKDVYSKELGRRTIQNGLLAYSLFQAWGNTPDQFEEPVKRDLLTATKTWRGDKDQNFYTIKNLLNVPTIIPGAAISDFPQNSTTRLDWHFNYQSKGYSVYVIDSRTWRSYPSRENDFDFVDLISQSSFDKQFPEVFPDRDVILIVSPSPVIGEPFLEKRQQTRSTLEDRYDIDTEAWTLNQFAFEKLFGNLVSRLPIRDFGTLKTRVGKLAFLSGDVHYGLSARYQVWGNKFVSDRHPDIATDAVLAQLTASSFKNQTWGWRGAAALLKKGTETLHTGGYPLDLCSAFFLKSGLPEPVLNFAWRLDSDQSLGEYQPSRQPLRDYKPETMNGLVLKLVKDLDSDKVEILTVDPDWRYRIDWILGTSTGVPPGRQTGPNRITVPPSLDKRKAVMQEYLVMARDHRSYTKEWGAGKEIVGMNNLGEIRFNFAGDRTSISQTIWWRLNPDKGGDPLQLFPLTTFNIPMNHTGDENKYTPEKPPIPLDPPTYHGL